MTSRRIPANLRLDIRPSRLLASYIVLGHSLALLCLLFSGVPFMWMGGLALLLLISGMYHISTLFRQSGPYYVRALAWRAGQWFLVTAEGESEAELLSSWVLPAAVGLQMKARSRFHMLVLPDSCAADDFRRLRQILRFAGSVSGVQDRIERLG